MTLSEVGTPSWSRYAVVLGALAMAIGGLLLASRPRVGRAMTLVAIAVFGVAMRLSLGTRPDVTVLFGGAAIALLAYVVEEPTAITHTSPPCPSVTARHGAWIAAAASLAPIFGPVDGPTLVGVAITVLVALLLLGRWARMVRAPRWSRAVVLGLLGVGAGAGALFTGRTGIAASAAALALLLAATFVRRATDDEVESVWDRILDHPSRALVATFAVLAAVGTLLLVMPASAANGQSIGILDGAFTSVSAVCVTGLIVLDTPNAFSGLGQVLLLVLIQVGGLGIMAFYTITLAALGRRISIRHELAVAGALNVGDRRMMVGSVRRILTITLVSEAIGALLLAASFARHGDGFGEAVWRGVFTSVSAFCNAGFALQSDSLVGYQTDPLILHTVAALIVIGGLSPPAVIAIPTWIRGRRVNLQASLILWSSLALIVVGALLYGLMEWTVSLEPLSYVDRLHNAWFQSITLRTAGFNSVDLAIARPATQTIMILFMFVGGSPGGTAGGVKTTTTMVLLLTVAASMRGRAHPVAFGRRLARATIYRAASVVTVGVAMALVALVAVELTQTLRPEVGIFEVVSALGTVGLSIGGTALLDPVGKVILMLCMFAGRVGPLTLFLFLNERSHDVELAEHPEGEVDVG